MEETVTLLAEENIARFLETIEFSSNLEVIGTAFSSDTNKEVFVLKNYSVTEGVEGAYIEVEIDEIIQKITDSDKAQEFLSVIQNDRAPIVLNGITRIVGYYSRVTNWNKSKVGELRDRKTSNYGLTNIKPVFTKERQQAIDLVTA